MYSGIPYFPSISLIIFCFNIIYNTNNTLYLIPTRPDERDAPRWERQQCGRWWTNHEAHDGGRSDHPQTARTQETGMLQKVWTNSRLKSKWIGPVSPNDKFRPLDIKGNSISYSLNLKNFISKTLWKEMENVRKNSTCYFFLASPSPAKGVWFPHKEDSVDKGPKRSVN